MKEWTIIRCERQPLLVAAIILALLLSVLAVYIGVRALAATRRRKLYVPKDGDLRIRFASGRFYAEPDLLARSVPGPRDFVVFACTTTRQELRRCIPDDEKPATIEVYENGEWGDLSRVSW